MKLGRASWLLLSVALVAFGCAKGDTGPTGPAGSANVIYSAWFSPATWVLETNFGIVERTYTMTSTSLTQAIIDNGVVLVYLKVAGFSPAIEQLPVTIIDASKAFLYRAQAGSIKALYYNTANTAADPGVIPSGNQLRYVLIPGSVLGTRAQEVGSTSARYVEALKAMSYSEACRTLGIPE